jgi:hypothetical protein
VWRQEKRQKRKFSTLNPQITEPAPKDPKFDRLLPTKDDKVVQVVTLQHGAANDATQTATDWVIERSHTGTISEQ